MHSHLYAWVPVVFIHVHLGASLDLDVWHVRTTVNSIYELHIYYIHAVIVYCLYRLVSTSIMHMYLILSLAFLHIVRKQSS